VLHLAELVMSNALAPMEIFTATIRRSSRLAVLTVLVTVAPKDTSALRMLQEELGAALMYVSFRYVPVRS
jgi:hypothetical protein